MPKLHHWADLAFIAYQHQCGVEGQSVKRLKNVFRCDIKNEITHAIIGAILPDRPERSTVDFLPFESNSKEAKALIATPNGAGVAWMLLAHRKQLGWKTIVRVTVMTDADCLVEEAFKYQRPHFWFGLADVES